MRNFLTVISIGLGGSTALAGTIEGIVKNKGSDMNLTVVLTDKEQKDQALCLDDFARRIGHLASITVKAEGEWTPEKKGAPKCFAVKDFTVTDTGSGRPPIVGILESKDGYYVIVDAAGVAQRFKKIPSGMIDLTGKKLIVDAKQVDAVNDGRDKIWKVVTYSEFP